MEEYKDISRGLKMLLDKAEEMGWNWETYIEPGSRRTYVEIGQSSPAGEDFSMTIDFDEENQADSSKDSLESYYEDFDIDEHIEMWIEAKRSGMSGVPSTRELVKDAEAIDGMILELSQALQKVNIPVLVGSYTPPDENGEGEKIVREFYGQGHIFKDEDALYHRPDDPCYIPELSDTVYTRNSILQECNQQDDLAEEVFKALDWQHVSSLLEDWQRNGELDTCKECGKMFNCYGVTKCPYCGADYEGGDDFAGDILAHHKKGGEFGEEIDTVDLELADGKKITAPAVVDVSALGCMDELEYELWHVIEDYMVQFGIRTQDDEPDWATVKAVQDSIFTAFTDAGVNFKFLSDEKLGEIEKAIKKKESESWAAKRKKNR